MKYTINHTCGHESIKDIVGTNVHGERERKAAYYETTLCPECYHRQQAEATTGAVREVKLSYCDYKNTYAEFKKKPDSYNAKAKTIIVYIPESMDVPEAI